MIKNRIRQYLPDKHTIHNSRSLRCLGTVLHDTRLWHFNRRSIANALALGLFAMWFPLPMQMLLVAIAAIPCRANLPLAVTTTWITNPITAPPMFFGAYLFGAWVLQDDVKIVTFTISKEWFTNTLGQIWEPLLLGCLILAIVSAAIGYVSVQLSWRFFIHKAIEKRRRREAEKQAKSKT